MSNLYNEFENKFQLSYFSAGWVDVEAPAQAAASVTVTDDMHQQIDELFRRKDLETLERELDLLKENMENITQKQLRLSNLAKFYQ